jgi:hypothetical protein
VEERRIGGGGRRSGRCESGGGGGNSGFGIACFAIGKTPGTKSSENSDSDDEFERDCLWKTPLTGAPGCSMLVEDKLDETGVSRDCGALRFGFMTIRYKEISASMSARSKFRQSERKFEARCKLYRDKVYRTNAEIENKLMRYRHPAPTEREFQKNIKKLRGRGNPKLQV